MFPTWIFEDWVKDIILGCFKLSLNFIRHLKYKQIVLIVRINYIKYCIDRKIENLILVITVNHKVYHAARRYLRHF